MLVLDASSIIYGWDNYPISHFPKVWEWLAHKIATNKITMASVALDEVGHVSPECAKWLKEESGLAPVHIDNAILKKAASINNLLGIKNDAYGNGVDENDVFIIATAHSLNATLISNEAIQVSRPQKLANYKIPAVCAMQKVDVTCITFLDLLKKSKKAFT